MTSHGYDNATEILKALIAEEPCDERRSTDLRWANRVLRRVRLGLMTTWALQGMDHRYPTELIRLRTAIRTGRIMTVQEARLMLAERQLRSGRPHHHQYADETVRCLQTWIKEVTKEER